MKETPRQKVLLDKLAAALKGIEPERLRSMLAKDATIIFRLTESDKASMTETASALGLTLTEYLCRLHFIAVEVLARISKGGRK